VPARRRSPATSARAVRRASFSVTSTRATGVRRERLAVVLARRTSARTAVAASRARGVGRSRPVAARRGTPSGQGLAWTEPSRHPDQTSSVTNDSTGANRRTRVSRARRRAPTAEARPAGPASPEAPPLPRPREGAPKVQKKEPGAPPAEARPAGPASP